MVSMSYLISRVSAHAVTIASIYLLSVHSLAIAETAEANRVKHEALSLIGNHDLKQHVDILADDTFEGRGAGTRGGRAAAGYIREKLDEIGVQPGGIEQTYSQPFKNNYQNLLAIIPGTDPDVKDEYILIGAHYDHVGYGNSRNSYGPTGYIHNGADDNASGTSALLELAQALMHHPCRRSVLIAFWDAEEQGLLGSKYFVKNPTVAIDTIKFVFNMDMVGRLRDNKLTLFGTRSWGDSRHLLSEVNCNHGDTEPLEIGFDWEIKANSDHYPFFKQKIPYLMPHTGLHDDYHRPRDDAHKINVDGITLVSQFVYRVVLELDERGSLPAFRETARRESKQHKLALEKRLPLPPKRLGVSWHRSNIAPEGLVVTRVASNSPADQAGIHRGDTIISFNGEPIRGDADMRSAVLSAPKESQVTITREGLESPAIKEIALRGAPVKIGISWRNDEAERESVIVTRVIPGSPAYEAGLQCADRIHMVGALPWSDYLEPTTPFTNCLFPLRVVYERNGKIAVTEVNGTSLGEQTAEIGRSNDEGS